jgi:uncharacterized protein YceH (UPF0502 family)
MEIRIDEKEARVIGCLIEKQLATPEYYPLSLNALTNACNQKSNRDPVVEWDETIVEAIADGLIQKKLAHKSMVGRVPKYEELFVGKHNLVPREAAIVCELLLRGAQTSGELRGRTARLCHFASLEEVLETLNNLESWGMAQRQARLPGHKESRYAHLLSGPLSDTQEAPPRSDRPTPPAEASRLEALENEIKALKAEVQVLRNDLETFKKQFS